MKSHTFLLLHLCVTIFSPATANPVAATDDIQVQENFNEEKIHGKWFTIALGSTCRWLKKHGNRFTVGTMTVVRGNTSEEIDITTTRLRQGFCSQVTRAYQKTDIPGKFTYYNPKWDSNAESYVVHTNYDEYAILVTRKNSSFGLSTTAALYGRNPEVRQDLVAEFKQLAVGLGIPEDSIVRLVNKGECVPRTGAKELQERVRRSAVFDEEGSADSSGLSFADHREDHCRLNMDPGPCLGMLPRYFYNTTSGTCETFFYGGCLGNGNNFHSEKACLQTCRTEAACRLPLVPGRPCKQTLWAFDASKGKCVPFSGCGGNANKFYLEKECKEYCGVLPDGEEEFLHLSASK